MDMFVVNGGRALRGVVPVSGSKNATLPMMAAALALTGPTRLLGAPRLADVNTLSEMLTQLGVRVQRSDPETLELEVEDEHECVAPYELVRRMRASICVLGPLIARRKRACVSLPGGCNIGHRPIDLHLKGLAALGAEIAIERGYVVAQARRLQGAVIDLSGPAGSTVTGTCNVMTAACLATGRSILLGAALEPEVVDLGEFLMSAGARISGLGTSILEIEGVDELRGVTHRVIPDRIEAATLLIAAAITGGELFVQGARPEHLQAVVEALRGVGVIIESRAGGLVAAAGRKLQPTQVTAAPYPGFPTDVQAQLTALLCLANGTSEVIDNVFPDRFLHLPELCRLGAQIRREGGRGQIQGVGRLCGASVMASDLRASAALLLAALAADGESLIRRIYHLDRGYERLEQKLSLVGAQIQRVRDEVEQVPPVPFGGLDSDNHQGPPAPRFLELRSLQRQPEPQAE